MGFFGSMFKKMGNAMMSQFGINRPRDSLRVLENVIRSNRSEEDKVKYARPILMWLKQLSLSNDNQADEANYVLDDIRRYHSDFLRDNDIDV